MSIDPVDVQAGDVVIVGPGERQLNGQVHHLVDSDDAFRVVRVDHDKQRIYGRGDLQFVSFESVRHTDHAKIHRPTTEPPAYEIVEESNSG